MRKYICLILGLFICQISIAQETRKNFDFIITVDEEITGALYRSAIIVKQGMNILKKIDVHCHPGELSLSTEDYNTISSKQDITLFFQFDYYQYSPGGKQKKYNYEIEIEKNWFELPYVILRIYNTCPGKYKRRLNPLSEDNNYAFKFKRSSGQIVRLPKEKYNNSTIENILKN